MFPEKILGKFGPSLNGFEVIQLYSEGAPQNSPGLNRVMRVSVKRGLVTRGLKR